MFAFTFMPEVIAHSTFIAFSITDLCVGRRGTLIKTYSCQWNQNHKPSFSIPLPDSKTEMTLVPPSFGSCRGNKVPTYGSIFPFQARPTLSCSIAFWCHLIITVRGSRWTQFPWVWAPLLLCRLAVDLHCHSLKESAFVHFSFPWKRASLPFNDFCVYVVPLFSLPYL